MFDDLKNKATSFLGTLVKNIQTPIKRDTGGSFFDTLTRSVKIANPIVGGFLDVARKNIQPKTPVFQARLGEGLSPEQQVRAKEVFNNPDTAFNEGVKNNPVSRENLLFSAVQAPSTLLGKGIVEPSWNFLSSGAELATGTPLPKLNLPALRETPFIKDYAKGSSYQQKYVEAIEGGATEKEAYQNTLIGGFVDAISIAVPIKNVTGNTLRRTSNSIDQTRNTNILKTNSL